MFSRSDLLTLFTINFIVVTKGAERISEVSARFTLDAMPGKQMAIDADLNAGLINQQQAQTRRKDVASEADFYGAMDGASKFVRGDAIAGMMILAINLIGGVCIGIFKYDLSAEAAFQQYVLMTIGDGLVAQILPAAFHRRRDYRDPRQRQWRYCHRCPRTVAGQPFGTLYRHQHYVRAGGGSVNAALSLPRVQRPAGLHRMADE